MVAPNGPLPHSGPTRQPLVGRDAEQAELRAHLRSAINGQGSLVLIGGEAGIGKTTLVESVARKASVSGALVLTGHCYDLTTTPPYGPWVEVARSYRPNGELPELPSTLKETDALGTLGSQAAIFDEVRVGLSTLAQHRPLVLVLEDLHWADQASLDLLRYMARQIANLPFLLIVTYRDDEITRQHLLYQLMPSLVRESHGRRIDLHRLEIDAVHQLVHSRYQLSDSDETRLVTYLQNHAEGNPFFADELLRSLEDQRLLTESDEGWTFKNPDRVHVPVLVRQFVDQRLAKLGTEDRELLETAAVIGQVIPLDLWGATSDATDEQLSTTVERATEAHVIEETPDRSGLRFTHALVREALYDGLALPRRRSQHLRIAETLTGFPRPHPDTVAYHYQQAADDRAVEWLILAGELAQRSYAWSIAAERFQTALAILESSDGRIQERGWLLYRVARLLRFSSWEQSIAYLEEVERLAVAGNDMVLEAFSLADRSMPRMMSGNTLQAIADLEAGLAKLDDLPERAWNDVDDRVASWVAESLPVSERHVKAQGGDELAQLRARRGVLVGWIAAVGRFRDAMTIGKPFVDELQSGHDAGGNGDATNGLGVAYSELGRPLEAEKAFASALQWFQSISHHLGYYVTILIELRQLMLTYWPDRVEERWELVARGIEAERRAREMLVPGISIHLVPIDVLFVEGRWTDARAIAEHFNEHGAFRDYSVTDCTYAAIAYGQGDTDLVWDIVHRHLPDGPDTGPGGMWADLAFPLQRLAIQLSLDSHALHDTRIWLEAHDRWLAWTGSVLRQAEGKLLWARYHHASDNLPMARGCAIKALELASEPRLPLIMLAIHRFIGMLDTGDGMYPEAADHLQHALRLADACAAPYERALTLFELATLHSRTRDTRAALTVLDEVETICTPMDTIPLLDRAAALRAKLTALRTPARYPAGLTAREVDVLKLVAEGLTDAQVADQLYVSRRTVTSHLTSIYTKLDVSSRAAATRFAVEQGLTS